MQMEEKLEKMSERLEALEHKYNSGKKVVKVSAGVFVVLLVTFFGISLSQINKQVTEAVGDAAVKTAIHKAADALKENETVRTAANVALTDINSLKENADKVCADINDLRKQYGEIVPIYRFCTNKPYRTPWGVKTHPDINL